jgi:hypothetical protein
MSEEGEILSLIKQAASDPTVTQQLQVYTYRVEYLPILDRVLSSCQTVRQNRHLCLLMLRDLILNRGCLLSLEELQAHLSLLLSVGNDLADYIETISLSVICLQKLLQRLTVFALR